MSRRGHVPPWTTPPPVWDVPPDELCTTPPPVCGARTPGVGRLTSGAAGVLVAEVGTGAGDAGAVDVCGLAGAGRCFSAGVAMLPASAGTDAGGVWMATGAASELAGCEVELDFVATPAPNAAAPAMTAQAAGSQPRVHMRARASIARADDGGDATLCDGALLNLDVL